MPEIKHEIGPTPDLVKEYENLLNYYLSPHKIEVGISIYKDPLDITCTFSNGQQTSTWIERHWIEDVVVNSPEVRNLSVTLFSDGIEGGTQMKARAWGDAHHIQDMVYKELKRQPSVPPKEADPYWELWKKHPIHPS